MDFAKKGPNKIIKKSLKEQNYLVLDAFIDLFEISPMQPIKPYETHSV